jgi:hypothetical protein
VSAERFVIVVEYEADADEEEPLAKAVEQIRERMHHPDQPDAKVVQVYAAIRESADAVLSVFEKSRT